MTINPNPVIVHVHIKDPITNATFAIPMEETQTIFHLKIKIHDYDSFTYFPIELLDVILEDDVLLDDDIQLSDLNLDEGQFLTVVLAEPDSTDPDETTGDDSFGIEELPIDVDVD